MQTRGAGAAEASEGATARPRGGEPSTGDTWLRYLSESLLG